MPVLLAWGPYSEISEESKGDQLIQLIEVFFFENASFYYHYYFFHFVSTLCFSEVFFIPFAYSKTYAS